ncbi:cytochrome c [Fimbriiglobus ruber]|uniref:Cytochrome c n=1 Tax=Fimbriiglobus ruber TaxID=1908690 RepID=A0A225E4T0_9BACT|nr:cytochrome c [Fimbriiglobus ruber]OWK43417.1 hypothetical protein FRUB_03016 [Fimbriiglobus ruber]
MRTQWIRRPVGVAGLAVVVWLAAAESPAKETLPEGVAGKLIDADVAYLQKALTKAPEKTVAPTLKAVAMEIALYAQNNLEGADANKMAALRAQALKVAEALTKKDYPAAKAAAEGLAKPTGGDKKALKLHELYKYDVNEVMSAFRNSPRGLNTEKDIRAQAKNVTDIKLAGELGARSALAAEYTLLLPSSDAVGAKKKTWEGSAQDMGRLGQEIATEAAKGAKADKAVLKKKLAALDATCTACHNVFK